MSFTKLMNPVMIFYKIEISRLSRLMLNNYEIGLKYIPQTYFEMIKLVRSSWYHFEVKKALESLKTLE